MDEWWFLLGDGEDFCFASEHNPFQRAAPQRRYIDSHTWIDLIIRTFLALVSHVCLMWRPFPMYQFIHLVSNTSHVFHKGVERTLIRISPLQPVQGDAKFLVTSQMSRYGEMDNNIQSISPVIHTVVTIAVKYVGGGRRCTIKQCLFTGNCGWKGLEGCICFFSADKTPIESMEKQKLASKLMYGLIVL